MSDNDRSEALRLAREWLGSTDPTDGHLAADALAAALLACEAERTRILAIVERFCTDVNASVPGSFLIQELRKRIAGEVMP